MALPEVVTRKEWLEARAELLAEEKELTRRRDALNTARRMLPMVKVDKEYEFLGPAGPVSLAGLFGESRQLMIQHVMFGPDWASACPSCTVSTAGITRSLLDRLRARETAFAMVCRAPWAKIEAYTAGRGWVLPWYSSYESDFNYDFRVTLDASVPQLEYNYRLEPNAISTDQSTELPGMSCFLREDGQIYHTYSAYARGLDHFDVPYGYLDLTALGRQEPWEEPKGRAFKAQNTL